MLRIEHITFCRHFVFLNEKNRTATELSMSEKQKNNLTV